MGERFDMMMAKLRAHAKTDSDRLLLALFTKHKAAVAEHFESCVPALDGSDFWKFKPSKDYPLSQFHGPLFHKGFRQFDVTGNGKDDVQIWKLLAGTEDTQQAEAFWDAHDHAMKTEDGNHG